jgi:hypothetical protein
MESFLGSVLPFLYYSKHFSATSAESLLPPRYIFLLPREQIPPGGDQRHPGEQAGG